MQTLDKCKEGSSKGVKCFSHRKEALDSEKYVARSSAAKLKIWQRLAED